MTTEVGTLVVPALLGDALHALAAQIAAASVPARSTATVERHVGALVGRLMFPGGLTAATRHAGAEPLWTERAAPYQECTLRQSAQRMVAAGGVRLVERALERQVERAVEASGARAMAFTDMHDQPYYTKAPAHAGPIGRLGNRILAAVYFGLTYLRVGPDGPTLAYHVSWHKPATPLIEALKDVSADPHRRAWMHAWIWMHNWDRGGNGEGVLRWALQRGIPYFTVANGHAYWRHFEGPATHTTANVPVFVRSDRALRASIDAAGEPLEPRVVIFPAHPAKGIACNRSLRYRTAAAWTDAELATLDQQYKRRWPSMENQIKAQLAVGFGINRERSLELTTSRGVDGQLARLRERAQTLEQEIDAFHADGTASAQRKAVTRRRKLTKVRAQRRDLLAAPLTKSARVPTGIELFCKNLLLLLSNALILLLSKSTLEAVRNLAPGMVRELLLRQPALACVERGAVTLWIDPIPHTRQRPLQRELIRLMSEEVPLRLHGRALRLRLREATKTNTS